MWVGGLVGCVCTPVNVYACADVYQRLLYVGMCMCVHAQHTKEDGRIGEREREREIARQT